MKTEEQQTLDTLRAIDTRRSYMVGRDEWSYSHASNGHQDGRATKRSISILPGFGESACTRIDVPGDAPTLEQALTIVRLSLQPYIAPPMLALLP